ncbi:DUF4424 family protein [Massilia sp. TSP1-1-2]|uniref:DUF4424 family protein n=1 Tax=Massilia sp. TSP1-1-2 TaxID=2804649 RepID=UPI003CF139E6
MKNLLLAGLLVPVLALASEGMDGVPVGGIVLNNTDRIALKKQVIGISRTLVSADYELLNESASELEETITFPLPEYPARQEGSTYYGEPSNLMITVDGKPAKFKTVMTAKYKDASVTAQLRKLGLTDAQIAYNPAFGVELAFNPLTPNQELMLGKQNLWTKNAAGVAGPAWTVQISYVWKQKFAPKSTVRVHHVYRPFVTTGAATWDVQGDFTTKYCADKAFMGAWKKAKAKAGNNNVEGKQVHYLLKNGNAWKNGIEDFTLNVTKLEAGELVSLCFPGNVRKPEAKTFQFHQTNFRPKQDLDVYFGNMGEAKIKNNSGVMPSLIR